MMKSLFLLCILSILMLVVGGARVGEFIYNTIIVYNNNNCPSFSIAPLLAMNSPTLVKDQYIVVLSENATKKEGKVLQGKK